MPLGSSLRFDNIFGGCSECLRSSHLSSSLFGLFVSFKLTLRGRSRGLSCSTTQRTAWYTVSCLRWWRPFRSKLSCLPRDLSSRDVLRRNSVFLSCLLRWKWSGDKARLNKGDPGLGEVWGVIVARCGDAGDPRRVKGDVLRGWCPWAWEWEGETEVGEGVLARGDTGTCADDFLLGERTARSFGIIPCRVPNRREKIRLGCLHAREWLKNPPGLSPVYGVAKKLLEILALSYFALWRRVVQIGQFGDQVVPSGYWNKTDLSLKERTVTPSKGRGRTFRSRVLCPSRPNKYNWLCEFKKLNFLLT